MWRSYRNHRDPGLTASFFVLVALWGLIACGRPESASLLEIGSVTPSRIVAGATFHIDGAGFPTGREATLTWDGVRHRPGLAGEHVHFEMKARAAGGDDIEAHANSAVMAALEGSFDGSVEVAFRSRIGLAPVVGKRDGLHVVFAGTADPDLAADLERARRSAAWLAFAGITLGDDPPPSGGVRVAGLRLQGKAEEAGLRAGDIVVRANGVDVNSAADLSPMWGQTSAELTVTSDNSTLTRRVRVSLVGFESTPDPRMWLWSFFGLLAWFSLLLLGTPMGAFMLPTWHRMRLARVRLTEIPGTRRQALLGAGVAALFALFVTWPRVHIDAIQVSLALVTLDLACTWLWPTHLNRAAAMEKVFTADLLAVTAIAALTLGVGSPEWAEIRAAARHLGFVPEGLSGPAQCLAVWACMEAIALRLPLPTWARTLRSGVWVAVLTSYVAPAQACTLLPRGLAAGAFAATIALTSGALSVIARIASEVPLRRRTISLFAGIAFCGCAAWAYFSPPADIAVPLARWCVALTTTLALGIVLRGRFSELNKTPQITVDPFRPSNLASGHASALS